MPQRFHFTTVRLCMLILNVFILGGCVVLIALAGLTGPRILLTIGTLGLAFAQFAKARVHAEEDPAGD